MNYSETASRLREASEANAAATERLRLSAARLAEILVKLLPEGERLPRQYEVRQDNLLFYWEETPGQDRMPVFLPGNRKAPREALHEFAQDVADGWLYELVGYLNSRTQTDNDAARILERAANSISEDKEVAK